MNKFAGVFLCIVFIAYVAVAVHGMSRSGPGVHGGGMRAHTIYTSDTNSTTECPSEQPPSNNGTSQPEPGDCNHCGGFSSTSCSDYCYRSGYRCYACDSCYCICSTRGC